MVNGQLHKIYGLFQDSRNADGCGVDAIDERRATFRRRQDERHHDDDVARKSRRAESDAERDAWCDVPVDRVSTQGPRGQVRDEVAAPGSRNRRPQKVQQQDRLERLTH